MIKRLFIGLFIFFILSVTTAIFAQATCPADVILAIARAGSACLNLESDQACYGNPPVDALSFANESLFAQPGDRVIAENLQALHTSLDDGFGFASMRVQFDLPARSERHVTILLFGSASINNHVPPRARIAITSIATLNIRNQPRADADILAQVGIRGGLVADARTNDTQWLRVTIAGTGNSPDVIGWVDVNSISTTENLASLTVADGDTVFLHPFQSMTIATASDDARCAGTPESGVLIQSPNLDTPVHFSVNGVGLSLAGTVFIQGDNAEHMSVLDGELLVDSQYVPAGARWNQGAVEGFDRAELAPLPINNLPVRFVLPQPLDAAEIAAAEADYIARNTPPTPTPAATAVDNVCRYFVRRPVDLRAGPGESFEIVNSLSADRRVVPILSVRDANGAVWYQLQGSNWILASAVEQTGICDEIPTSPASSAPPPRTNHLSLETCESSNGPIRAGQTVTIDFVPPAFMTLADAVNATQFDPGRIMVENQRLRVRVSQPERIANERYVRVWSATWIAEAGTYRISGDRLDYEVLCDITVPVS